MTKNIWGSITEVVVLLSIFLFWAGSTSAQSADFSLQKIGDDVWVAIVTDAGKAGGNAGFVVGDDSIAVIDTFEDPVRRVSCWPPYGRSVLCRFALSSTLTTTSTM